MDLKELKIKYEEMGKEIERLENKKVEFVPKLEEEYFYVTASRNVDCWCYDNRVIDKAIIKYNKIFRTKGEALKYRDYLNAKDEASYNFSKEEWEDDNIEKHYFWFDSDEKTLETDFNSCVRYPQIHFKTEEDAQNFIDKYKKEILEFEFGEV